MDYIQKVKEELSELNIKRKALRKFLKTHASIPPIGMGAVEFKYMKSQMQAMDKYANCLEVRLVKMIDRSE